MLRFFKIFCFALTAMASSHLLAFAPVGPKEAWQADANGFRRNVFVDTPDVTFVTGTPEWSYAPHNVGEEFRWSVPTLYYAYDSSFVQYFNSNGLAAVDSAFVILNGLNNVDDYSTDLSEVPLEEYRLNYSAASLHLFDLKSAALELLTTRLGLADPERWTWLIHNRVLQPMRSCPFYDYVIAQRNFDPVTFQTTPYVNGHLFTYQILQVCPPDPRGDYAEAQAISVDPYTFYLSAVASPRLTFPRATDYGIFHSSLTRDDIGSLRYLYSTNNLNLEAAAPDVLLFQTNTTLQLLTPSNLVAFADQSLTNDGVTLLTLYPNLVILSETNTFTNVPITVTYFTNYPYDPAGTPAHLVTADSGNFTVQTIFHRTFGNLLTFQYINGMWTALPITDIATVNGQATITIQTISSTNQPYAPAGSRPLTNIVTTTYLTNAAVGEFFVLPPTLCDVKVVAAQVTNIFLSTNLIAAATNNPTGTNTLTQFFFQAQVTYFTNHTFVIYPVDCISNSVAIRQGLKKITFQSHQFDSLLSRFFQPVTNDFSVFAVTNNQRVVQQFRRIVTRPDILIAASDIALTAPFLVETVDHATSIVGFNTTTVPVLPDPNAGPGTIEGPVTLTFNKVGPTRLNGATSFLDEQSAILWYTWATYDGTTNAPIIYPDNAQLDVLSDLVLMEVSPSSLPDAGQQTGYNVSLSIAGGQAPYTWSVGPGSPALPPGLSLNQDPSDSSRATISGVPQTSGTFTFWIRVTDYGSRYVDQTYVLNIN